MTNDLLNHSNEGQLSDLPQIIAQSNAGLYEEALKSIDQRIGVNPRVGSLYYSKGYTLQYDLKKIEESLIYYTKAIEFNPADNSNYLYQAIAFNILKRHEEALQSYNKLISLDDKYEAAWIGRAITFGLLNRCKDGLSDIEHLLTLNPNNSNGLLSKANLLLKLEKYQTALEVSQSIIDKDGNNVEAWHIKAISLHWLGNLQQTLECYDQALDVLAKLQSQKLVKTQNSALDLDFEQIRNQLLFDKAYCLEDCERFDEAEEIIDKILAANPNNSNALYCKAGLYITLDKCHEALALVDKAIAIDSQCSSAYFTGGRAYYTLLDYPSAIKYFELAVSTNNLDNQDFRESLGYLGFSHECLANYQQAIAYFDKASTLILQEGVNLVLQKGVNTSDTDNTPTLYQLVKAGKASCLMYLSKNEEAERIIQEVLALNPSNGDALIVKARLLNLQGKYAEAISIAELAIEVDKYYTYPNHCKAVAMFHLGKYAEAIDCFALAFKLSWLPLNPSQVKQRYQEALNILEQIIKIEANTPNASRAKEVRDFALNQMKVTKLDKSCGGNKKK